LKRIALLIALCVAVSAQAPDKPKVFKVSAEQAAKLRALQDDYDKTLKQLQAIQTQWVIVAQRAALEAGMSAKDFDAMELAPTAEGFEFRVKQAASATPQEKKP